MIGIILGGVLAASIGGASQHIEIDVFNSGAFTRILLTNEGDRDVGVWKGMSDNSVSGNLFLEFFENGVPKLKRFEGHPVFFKKDLIKLSPGYSYGISIPSDFLMNAYGLKRGCYSLVVKVAFPPYEDVAGGYISSKKINICFNN